MTLKQNNNELRNTNGCYLVTQIPINPNNRLILRQLQSLRFFTLKLLQNNCAIIRLLTHFDHKL